MSALDRYEEYMLDVEDVKTAYQEAFRLIEFPENYGMYSTGIHPIENRAPGTPISASIWNSTINELRNICAAVASSMAAYNKGVGSAFDIFVEKINAMMRHLLENEYIDFLQFLSEAQFNAFYEYEPGTGTDARACYLHFTIGEEGTEEFIDVKSDNIWAPQLIWDVATEPEPVDEFGNPVWRIKINTDNVAPASSYITDEQLQEVLGEVLSSIADTYATKDAVQQYISNVGQTITDLGTRIDGIEDGVADIADGIGTPSEQFIESTVWHAIDVIDQNTISPEEAAALSGLVENLDEILALDDAVSDLEDIIPTHATDLNLIKSAYNSSLTALHNRLMALSVMELPRYASTQSTGYYYTLDKTNARWTIVMNTAAQIDWIVSMSNSFSSANTLYRPHSYVYFAVRGNMCEVHGQIRTNAISKNISYAEGYIVPLLQIPKAFIPDTVAFDTIATTVCYYSNTASLQDIATVRILVRSQNQADTYYRADRSSTVAYILPADTHILALTDFKTQSGAATKPAAYDTIQFNLVYPLRYLAMDNNGTGTVSQADLSSAPGLIDLDYADAPTVIGGDSNE